MSLKTLWMVFFISSFSSVLLADEKTDYEKSCDAQWKVQHQGHHRHVGRAVCSCYADVLSAFKTAHQQDTNFASLFENYKRQASLFCVTGGVFDNSVQLAVFERISDRSSIEGICSSFWVGLMRAFKPVSADFNSKNICACGAEEMTKIVQEYDTLTPQIIRARSLSLVKKCDPTSTLTSEQFANIEKSLVRQEAITVSDKGKFILEIKDDPNPEYQKIADYLREYKGLNTIVEAMNNTLKIPYDIRIVTTTTGKGPYYTYAEKTIWMDYELMSIVLMLFDKYHPNESKENRDHYLNNLNRFLLYHELGHALIDAYQLPVLGQEEDGADALGAVISLKYIPLGYHVLVDAADFFKLLGQLVDEGESSYWDEHDLNEQRYYRLLCYAYGKTPDQTYKKVKHYYKSSLDTFIEERSEFCVDTYKSTYQDWMKLLKPYLKEEIKPGVKVQ